MTFMLFTMMYVILPMLFQ